MLFTIFSVVNTEMRRGAANLIIGAVRERGAVRALFRWCGH